MNDQTKTKGARRAGRIIAFQVIFSLGFHEATTPEQIEAVFIASPVVLEHGIGTARDFARQLVHDVWSRRPELDAVIERYSRHWKLDRIARVELSILRLALLEMMYRPDIPLKVAINEGIELAKKFGDDNSRNFINGILDAAAKAVDHGKLGSHKTF